MNIKNMKIGIQLQLGFAIIMVAVAVITFISIKQNDTLKQQTQTLYEHPYTVREAIDDLREDVHLQLIDQRDLMLGIDHEESKGVIQSIELASSDALAQFTILKERYLGAPSDVDETYKAYLKWKVLRDETTKLISAGELEKAKRNLNSDGKLGKARLDLLAKIEIIDAFATQKANTVYKSTIDEAETMNTQLIFIGFLILLLSTAVVFYLMRIIRKPLEIMTATTERFQNGEMGARSSYELRNEFGVLSSSFNMLAEQIQEKTELDEKVVSLAALMLSKYEAKEFFRETLNALAEYTGSQMAAVYLLSEDKQNFEHFESLGIDNNARQSFSAITSEGEFGAALSTRKVQHLRDIPQKTRFIFHTVSGKFIPREIITIPIIADKEVIAVISLSSINVYGKQATQLIDNIHVTLCTRIEGILAYHKMRNFSKQLESQNRELESQKSELASQSAELTEQNAELEMQKEQLSEVSRLKTNFLSNMSHELRTPLNSVIALSGVLNRRLAKQIPEEEYSYLEVIERNGKNLLKLINDILDIARIESGREEVELTTFNTHNLIADVVTLIQPQAKEKNIELQLQSNGKGIVITNDEHKLRHVLQNIIANAVKFTEKGKVEITALTKEDTIEIKITDTGIGITEEQLPHIFDEFRQADGSTSRRFGGTGLGLSIARKYSNLLGGEVTVKSVPGTGSEFTITLPLTYSGENKVVNDHETVPLKYPVTSLKPKHATAAMLKTILLVEDSEPAIIQLKDILEEEGYNLLVARNGGEALELISKTIPDGMILDLMMPGIDGFEVLKNLRNEDRTAHIPVLILTAKHITKEDLHFLKRNNVHQLIQKGDVNAADLMNALATMVSPVSVEAGVSKQKRPTIKGKPVVLVVEDNPDNMLTVKALLADNYTMIAARDGKEGIELAKKHIPDLILMDIALPDIDGIETFKEIMKDVRLLHIPVVALTASAMANDRETVMAHGFSAYISKPIDDKLFYKTIKEILYGE